MRPCRLSSRRLGAAAGTAQRTTAPDYPAGFSLAKTYTRGQSDCARQRTPTRSRALVHVHIEA
jgi:hypothetical protein